MVSMQKLSFSIHMRDNCEANFYITNLKGLPEDYKDNILARIELKPMVRYAYILLPSHIETAKAIKNLQCKGDVSEKYFMNLAEAYKVHLIWFDAKYRHIIIWGDEEEIKEVIAFLGEILKKPIKREYAIDQERERRDEWLTWMEEDDGTNKHS
jgi:hypothetical protein